MSPPVDDEGVLDEAGDQMATPLMPPPPDGDTGDGDDTDEDVEPFLLLLLLFANNLDECWLFLTIWSRFCLNVGDSWR